MEADDGEEGDEFRPGGDSGDDEATLEEEEAAAAAEGGGGGADEMDALLAEAVRFALISLRRPDAWCFLVAF
jgi:hypothetical protein